MMIRVVLMPKWTWLSFTIQWMSLVVRHVYFFLVTCYNIATVKSFCTRVDHPCVPGEPSTWNRGNGFPWRLCICPSSAPPRFRENLMITWKEGFALCRPSLLPTPTRIKQLVLLQTCLETRTKTSAYHSTKLKICIFTMLVPQHVKVAMVAVDGLFIQMEVSASLMVKLLLDGVWFPGHLMEELMSCLVPSSPPRRISLSPVHEHTPTRQPKWLPYWSIVLPWSHGPVAWDEQSCVYYDSQHAGGVWARSQNFGSPCNTCMVSVVIWVMMFWPCCCTWDLRPFLNQNVATRWIHLNFDPYACCNGCNNWMFGTITTHSDRSGVAFPRSELALCCPSGPSCVAFLGVFVCVSALSLLLSIESLFRRTCNEMSFFICLYRTEFRRLFSTQHEECSVGVANPLTGLLYGRIFCCWNCSGHDRTLLSLCYWLTLLQRRCVCFCMTLHRALLSGLVTLALGEFGLVPLRENVPGIYMLHRAGGYHLVHCPGSECARRLYIPWRGTAVASMVKPWSPSGPSLCDCPASLSDVFLTWAAFWVVASIKAFLQVHLV